MKKIILITGTSRGLGKVLYEQLSQLDNYRVYGTSRRSTSSADLILDISSEQSVQDCIKKLIAKEGRIDVLINNVGSNLIGSLEGTSVEKFQVEMNLNLYGSIRMIQEVMPYMRASAQGKIINISSIGGKIPLPYNSSYAASKAALEAMSESLSYELKNSGVYVSLIEPIGLDIIEETPTLKFREPEGSEHYKKSLGLYRLMTTKGMPSVSRQKVARTVQRVLLSKKPRLRYVVGYQGHLMLALKSFLPNGLYRKILDKILLKE